MEDFKDLRVWAKAHELTLNVYQKTRCFPKEELYGVTSQMRRSAASVGANIAEGCGRRSDGEMRPLSRSPAVRQMNWNHLLLPKDLRFVSATDSADLEAKVLEIQRMLASFAAAVKSAAAS